MCGRYYLTAKLDQLLERFGITETTFEYKPRREIYPSESAPVITGNTNKKKLSKFRWGFPLSFNNKLIINARSETIDSKKTFKAAFQNQRCLVPATGFFEWKNKNKYKIYHQQQPVISLAGLYDEFELEGKDIICFTIITTSAVKKLKEVHHRMPLIFSQDQEDSWLNPDLNLDQLQELLDINEEDNLRIERENKGQLGFEF